MNTDLEQVLAVLGVSLIFLVVFLTTQPLALQIIATFIAAFVGGIYGVFVKGSHGAVTTIGRTQISRAAPVYIFFLIAILVSTIVSNAIPSVVLGYIPGNSLNIAQAFGISLLFAIGTFWAMRYMLYRGRVVNLAAGSLTVILILYFLLLYVGVI